MDSPKTNSLLVEMHLAKQADCKTHSLDAVKFTLTQCRGWRTEAFVTQDLTELKWSYRYEPKQQIHFRSKIKLSDLPTPHPHPNPMEDSVSAEGAGSVRILVVQILFSVAVCAGDA